MKKDPCSLLRLAFLIVSLGLGVIFTWVAHSPTLPPQKAASLELRGMAQPVAPAVAHAEDAREAASVTESQPLPAPRLAKLTSVPAPTLPQAGVTRASVPASLSPAVLIRDVAPPIVGVPILVPGHFDGIMVSHVPLTESPQPVKPGTPRTPPTVIHNPPEKGGGTTYLLDATWDTPVFADGRGATATVHATPPPDSPKSVTPVAVPNK